MKIEAQSVVGIHYTLKNSTGEEIDSSLGADPLIFILGSGQIIAGLESELEGKTKGEKLDVVVAPENGYGVRNEQMVQIIPKAEFQDADTVKVGMQFQVDTPEGPLVLQITEIKENEFVVDANHPLAGQTLYFQVEVTEVRQATKDELEHGHVHGAGCNH